MIHTSSREPQFRHFGQSGSHLTIQRRLSLQASTNAVALMARDQSFVMLTTVNGTSGGSVLGSRPQLLRSHERCEVSDRELEIDTTPQRFPLAAGREFGAWILVQRLMLSLDYWRHKAAKLRGGGALSRLIEKVGHQNQIGIRKRFLLLLFTMTVSSN